MKKLFFIFLLILVPLIAIGQIALPEGIEEQISVDLSNNYPEPNETVSVSVVSYTSDLNKAIIAWSVNGKVEKREIGATNFSFQVGDVGDITTLSIDVTKRDGGTFSKKYAFNIAEVDLMYTAQTTVPPLYDGKALFSNQSAVKVFAEPRFIDTNGNPIPKEELVYVWEVNDFKRQDLSGRGRDFFEYGGSLITRPLEVSVLVSGINTDAYAKGSITLDPVDQKILIYEDNPILGIVYDQVVENGFKLKREEIKLKAENLYFNRGELLDIFWKIDGEDVPVFRNIENSVFRNENNSSGVARISIRTENPSRILQGSATDIKLEFVGNQNE